jgi:hypothetical protein
MELEPAGCETGDMSPEPKNVNSRAEFLHFVEALRTDLKQNPEGWENSTLDLYLDAIAAWVRAYENYYTNTNQPVPTNISWRFFADVLTAARIYE